MMHFNTVNNNRVMYRYMYKMCKCIESFLMP